MIFVTVGNAHKPFRRLVEAADRAAARCDEEFIIQSGNTPFEARHARQVPFLGIEEYERLVGRARIVVAHAGSGSIIAALTFRKPIIVMPRRAQYGEHVNDHQLEIAGALAAQERLRIVEDFDQLCTALANPFPPVPAGDNHKPPLVQVLERWLQHWTDSQGFSCDGKLQ